MPAAPTKSAKTRLALRFISGKYQGGEFPIEENREIVVGRSSELDMVLVEEMVSRKHAKIELKDGEILIEDLGSTNGTFVNGERIVKSRLKEGDRILIGSNILKVITTSSDEPSVNTRRSNPEAIPLARPQPRAREASSESRMSGSLEEIPLPDLLQLFGTSRKSGVLVVATDTDVGRVYLDKGLLHYVAIEPIDGTGADVAPLKAFYRMLTWDRGSFELEPPSDRKFEEPLDASVQEVLMEGFRQRDEFEHLKPKLPHLDSPLSIVVPLDAPLRELDAGRLEIFQLALNGHTMRSMLDATTLTDLDASAALMHLIDRGYVQRP
jgi:pSer/pThr/pTyr-binding forkhead associated (FHA) protein